MHTPVAIDTLYADAVALLQKLIATPSFSREEDATAALLFDTLTHQGAEPLRSGNNVWAQNIAFRPDRPTLLLNSHHDTVKPAQGWATDPFSPLVEGDRLTGLGSNDAGASLVCLIAAFRYWQPHPDLPWNLVLAATAEEEISGRNGIEALLPQLPPTTAAIVGEPTQLQLAVAEKGLMVLDCVSHGVAGHAARQEGDNAIYHALCDIEWFRTYQFPKTSDWLGPVHMAVTQIQAGRQHNVVPDHCSFVVDVRLTDAYTPEQVLDVIRQHVRAEVTPRSQRLRPTAIALEHPLVQAGLALGSKPYGSPTLSDKALMPFPALKAGPGDSARSHTANEYILLSELRAGIEFYIRLLHHLFFQTA